MTDKITLWQISDGKRGHENQSAGFIKALSRLHGCDVIKLQLDTNRASWLQAITGNFPPALKLSKPDLIIGTGSQTHSTLLAAGRATGAPTIVIMAPPRGMTRCFNFCIIPEHDNRTGSNVLSTKGAMNLIQASQAKQAQAGLFLIGGPSQHHAWDEAAILEQIDTILAAETSTQWTLTTSRRTPTSTKQLLQALNNFRLKVVPAEDTLPTWLPDELATASKVWVSEDSVSMVYEALSSGAKVGLLPVPRKASSSRVIRGLDSLTEGGFILPFDPKKSDLSNFKNPPALNEAARIATIIADQLKISVKY